MGEGNSPEQQKDENRIPIVVVQQHITHSLVIPMPMNKQECHQESKLPH